MFWKPHCAKNQKSERFRGEGPTTWLDHDIINIYFSKNNHCAIISSFAECTNLSTHIRYQTQTTYLDRFWTQPDFKFNFPTLIIFSEYPNNWDLKGFKSSLHYLYRVLSGSFVRGHLYQFMWSSKIILWLAVFFNGNRKPSCTYFHAFRSMGSIQVEH